MAEKTAGDFKDLLDFCYSEQKEDFIRLVTLQDSYDNRINRDVWPTQSEIPTAQMFVAVEEALGPALDMCFPETNGLQLLPKDPSTLEDQWRRSEWALWTMIQYTMRIRNVALRSVKDCYKCSIGYGIVEPFTITPQVSASVHQGGRSTPVLVDGEPQTSIRYRYVSPGDIFPYPEGVDFNGDDATPLCFFFDPYPLWEVESWYENGLPDSPGEDSGMLSSLTAVKKAADNFYKSSKGDWWKYRERMHGRMSPYQSSTPKYAPERIPIFKVFEQPGTETWWVPDGSGKGGEIIYRRKSDGITRVRNGLVKWTAWPDGKRWFPMSQPEADKNRGLGYDLWLNFFFDMMTRAKDARMVIDKSALPPDQRALNPYEDIYISGGNAQQAVSYLQPPNIDSTIPMIGDVLDRIGGKINGTKDFMQKNYTRGGTNAFQDLLNTMQARQRLSASILESGALTQIYGHVLANMQDIVPDGGLELARPVYSGQDRKSLLDRRTVTLDDLMHGYEIVVDTTERRMLGGMSSQERRDLYTLLKDDPTMRRAEVNRLLPLPDVTLRRIAKSDEEVEQVQRQEQDARLIGQLSGQGGMNTAAAAGQEVSPVEAGLGV
jgi:hypothetical protein